MKNNILHVLWKSILIRLSNLKIKAITFSLIDGYAHFTGYDNKSKIVIIKKYQIK